MTRRCLEALEDAALAAPHQIISEALAGVHYSTFAGRFGYHRMNPDGTSERATRSEVAALLAETTH